MTRIALVYFDAGGGHRSAATSIREILRQKQPPWDMDLVNLQELLDPIDIVRSITGLRVQDVYNSMLRNGWTLGSPQLMRALQWTIRAFHRPSVRLLERYWLETSPDMVVSFVPHFNRALCQSLGNTFPDRPFVTILTDIADYPPHFWIERQRQFLICGSERAVAQAKQMGHAESHIWKTSGMILNPRFYKLTEIDRQKEREKAGLEPARLTGLVLFGGQGSKQMVEIDRRLGGSTLPVQLIFICGKNAELERKLRAQKSLLPRLVEGFTTNVPYYMQLSDFFIGKPGPGSLAEAFAMGLPVIVERNAWTLPQERYNTEWIRDKQVGLVVGNFSNIVETVAQLLEAENFPRFRRNAAAMENHALFEIPEILQDILAGRINDHHASLQAGSTAVAS
jgi:hypothetical protein